MKLIINGFRLNKPWLVMGLLLLGKECPVVKLSKTSIKKLVQTIILKCVHFKKNLDNVLLPVNKAFQNILHSQRRDAICPVLEEVLSWMLLRPGFHSVSLHFALGWGGGVDNSHKDAAPVKVTCCLPGCCFAACEKHQCQYNQKSTKV